MTHSRWAVDESLMMGVGDGSELQGKVQACTVSSRGELLPLLVLKSQGEGARTGTCRK